MGTTGYISPVAVHPGETIKETLEVLGFSQTDLSVGTGLSERTISEILNGKNPVTAETALKFERVLGISRIGLANMQVAYDADLLRLKEEARLQKEAKYLEKYSCYLELVKLGFVKKTRDKIEKVEELLRFFSVDSLFSVREVLPVAFRKSNAEKVNRESLAAWLKIGKIEGQKIETEDFDGKKLKEKLPKMRALTKKDPKEYSQKLVEMCAECGIALVYTHYLKNTYVNGATRWLTPQKALIQLSLRYSYADIFWFTFFHEIGHLLRSSKKQMFVSFKDEKDISQIEKEADKFAQKILIPSGADYEKFKESLTPENLVKNLLSFSKTINVDPGIVAGRLGKETGEWRSVALFRKQLCFK